MNAYRILIEKLLGIYLLGRREKKQGDNFRLDTTEMVSEDLNSMSFSSGL
jgi:hypothetical protein